MTRRTYDQQCGLAAALDLVGERWTLLIVRELMTGSKRYTDLTDGLAGIGTSLLAERLRRLEADGILVRRTLPPPTPATLYELSDVGIELGRAIMPLVAWGLTHALPGAPGTGQPMRAAWSLLPFVYGLAPDALAQADGVYEFRLNDDAALLTVADGRARITSAESGITADVIVTLTPEVAADIGAGRLDAQRALDDGRLHVDGDRTTAARLIAAFQSR